MEGCAAKQRVSKRTSYRVSRALWPRRSDGNPITLSRTAGPEPFLRPAAQPSVKVLSCLIASVDEPCERGPRADRSTLRGVVCSRRGYFTLQFFLPRRTGDGHLAVPIGVGNSLSVEGSSVFF